MTSPFEPSCPTSSARALRAKLDGSWPKRALPIWQRWPEQFLWSVEFFIHIMYYLWATWKLEGRGIASYVGSGTWAAVRELSHEFGKARHHPDAHDMRAGAVRRT